MSEKGQEIFQRVRNILYAISAVLGIMGFTMDESVIDPIAAGVVAVFAIITDIIAWWYSRKKYRVEPVSEPPVAS